MVDLMQLKIATGQAINILSNNGQINLIEPTQNNIILVKKFTKFILDCQTNNLDLMTDKVKM